MCNETIKATENENFVIINVKPETGNGENSDLY